MYAPVAGTDDDYLHRFEAFNGQRLDADGGHRAAAAGAEHVEYTSVDYMNTALELVKQLRSAVLEKRQDTGVTA